jgi:hypothetical protein
MHVKIPKATTMNDYLVSNRRTLHRNRRYCLLLVLLFFFPILFLNCEAAFDDPTNVHAMIVSSSRYWFNYRHAINALGMYEIYRRNGIPDENIILSTFFFSENMHPIHWVACSIVIFGVRQRFRRKFIECDYLMIFLLF